MVSTAVVGVCAQCHSPLATSSPFCTRCGALVTGAVTQQAPTHQDAPERRAQQGGTTGAPAVPYDPALGPAFDGAVVAGLGRRVLAYLVDALAVTVLAGATFLLTSHWVYSALIALEAVVALVLWEARSGRTLGHTALGLRVSQLTTPHAPGLGRAAGRAVVLGAGHVLVLGQWLVLASPAFDRSGRRQGWHDVVGGTVVIDVRGMRRPRTAPPQDPAPQHPAPPAAAQLPAPQAPDAPVVETPPVPTPAVETPPVPTPPAQAAPVAPWEATRHVHRAEPTTPTTWVVTLDTGEAMSVSGPGHVGRRPSPPEGEACEHLITIADPGRSLSRTHARFGIDGSGFWVEDCGSANGTAVLTADGTAMALAPGERVVVPPGGAVRLGDRTFTVAPLT